MAGRGAGSGLRVVVSHTSEFREFPRGGSYVAAVERAISACGHVIVDMADFPAADLPPAALCAERVQGCEVYVGVLGTRYGSPVWERPEVSYTELEFAAATEAGLERLIFELNTAAEDCGIPPSGLIDLECGARQEAFRSRVRGSGLTVQKFSSPAMLGLLVERSLRELAARRAVAAEPGVPGHQGPVVAGEVPQAPVGYQPRAELLAVLDAPESGLRVQVAYAVTGMRGVGKTHLAAAVARARLPAGHRYRRAADQRPAAAPRPRPPRHPGLTEQPRPRLPGRGQHHGGHHLARTDPHHPRTRPRPRPPRDPAITGQRRLRLPGRVSHPGKREGESRLQASYQGSASDPEATAA